MKQVKVLRRPLTALNRDATVVVMIGLSNSRWLAGGHRPARHLGL
jgi:hypothetical protein